MNKFIGCLIVLLFVSCSVSNEKINWSAEEILAKCIQKHDPENNWDESTLQIYIQEPRISNPSRFSILNLNNKDGSFELTRNRDDHLSKHTIDRDGNSKVYLDDSEEIQEELVEKYRLNPERNSGYRDFYKMLYGLPMTLTEKSIRQFKQLESGIYNNLDCYKIPIELEKEMFSKDWIIYISKDDFEFKGMEIVFPGDSTKGERLYFDGSIVLNGILIPRIRHWHEFANGEYSGSDIIIKEL